MMLTANLSKCCFRDFAKMQAFRTFNWYLVMDPKFGQQNDVGLIFSITNIGCVNLMFILI